MSLSPVLGLIKGIFLIDKAHITNEYSFDQQLRINPVMYAVLIGIRKNFQAKSGNSACCNTQNAGMS